MNAQKEKLVLRVALNGGEVDGKTKVLTRSYSQMLLTSTDEGLLATGEALGELQALPVLKISKVEEYELKR